MIEDLRIVKCEWCTKTHLRGYDHYRRVVVFDVPHVICEDCYRRLLKVM